MTLSEQMNFISHRSTLTCMHGCAASTQTLASQIGIDILKSGGNAADAAVAIAAALNVTEPCSTGIGGDAFCLFYSKKTNTVQGLNASGRAPQGLTLEYLNKHSFNESSKLPLNHALTVTVPGACAGWVDCVESFGSGNLSLEQILQPAINLAREGFPVSGPITANLWHKSRGSLLLKENRFGSELLIKDDKTKQLTISARLPKTHSDDRTKQHRAPAMGEIFKNPGLAKTLEAVAAKGKKGFYRGWVADALVDVIKEHGGILNHEDLKNHTSTFVEPINVEYKGVKLWEIPPNGQGIVALEALNILKNFNMQKFDHNSVDYLHIVIEAIKLSFADALQYCADATKTDVPILGLLDKEYGTQRASLLNNAAALDICTAGDPPSCQGDTVYFTTADKDGNFCSFINSNYTGFGTGLVPEGCGFTLQNRGYNFSLKEGHPNVVAPGKRPYHTIIPAMVTDAGTGEILMSYGVMGGYMQPQGHVQVLLNMIEFGMDPQQALDAPRFLLGSGHLSPLGTVHLEKGIDEKVASELRKKGHNVSSGVGGFDRSVFGRGQIAARRNFWNTKIQNSSVLWVASDPRGDGVSMGY